jgi:hypothetical protein
MGTDRVRLAVEAMSNASDTASIRLQVGDLRALLEELEEMRLKVANLLEKAPPTR